MPTTYDHIAGQSKERLAAISDGIFGVAMTLMLLELHTPVAAAVKGELSLLVAMKGIAPAFLVYLMSYLTLGIFWVGQQTELNHLERSDRHLTWLHLGFLFFVTIVPLSTRLLTEFIYLRVALLFYWFNIFLLGGSLLVSWRYAIAAGLVSESIPVAVRDALCRRIVISQSLYAVGAALCIVHTYCSIAFIVLLQLNYVVAPHLWWSRDFAIGPDDDEE
jgi:uncharacterized membrane protein